MYLSENPFMDHIANITDSGQGISCKVLLIVSFLFEEYYVVW